MARRRGTDGPRLLLAGPARLCEALGIAREHNGLDLVAGAVLHIERGLPVPDADVGAGPRVGITMAMENPWRFVVTDSRYLSRRNPPRPSRRPGRLTG